MVQYHHLVPRWRHPRTSMPLCAPCQRFYQPMQVFQLERLLFSAHSLCSHALNVLTRRLGSSSRSVLPTSAASSQQLCFTTRPPGSESMHWFTLQF